MVPHFVGEMHRLCNKCKAGEKYGAGGEFENKVIARVKNAEDPVAETLKIAHFSADRLDKQSPDLFLGYAENFKRDWNNAKTDEEKDAAINQFANDFR